MRYVAAYMLCVLGGNEDPSEADIKKILSSVGIDVEADKLSKVMNALKGKNIEELIAEGHKKLASMPAVAGGISAGGGAPAAGEADAGKAEEKKEEPKKVESDSEDEDMGFGLFD